MKDYIHVISKIRDTPWLITESGLEVILSIVNERLNNGKLSDEEIQARLMGLPESSESSLNNLNGSNGIGVISLSGPLFGKANLLTEMSGATSLETFQSQFRTMMNDNSINSIIMDVDSPGGTSDLVQEVGEEIYAARGVKPIYAIANTAAGSAAYWLASQAEHLYMTLSGMVGSIGAYTVHEDQSEFDKQQGKRFTFISAGKYKTEGNPHEALSEEGRAYRKELIDDIYTDFVSAVATGRGVTVDQVMSDFGDGRMVNAKTALSSGMVDGITTMDGLVELISSKPTQVRVVNSAGVYATGTLLNGEVTINPMTNSSWATGTGYADIIELESKEYEHSEPGTGSPPAPRRDEDGSDDIAITQRWRRSPLPLDPTDPTAPSPNPARPNHNVSSNSWKEGNKLAEDRTAEEIVAELREGMNLKEDDDLVASVKSLYEADEQLKATVLAASEEDDFAEKYPALWKEHQELLTDRAENRARAFAESVQTLGVMEGDQMKPSKFGLSALAVKEITECHMKFAAGKASLADFEDAIKVITQGGIVEYGEKGSARQAELPTSFDPSTAEGIIGVRKEFAAKVAEIQKNDNLTYQAALAEASKRYPELATAYRMAVPVNTH